MLGQRILDPGRYLGIDNPIDEAVFFQDPQVNSDRLRVHVAHKLLQPGETLRPIAEAPDYHQVPFAAHDLHHSPPVNAIFKYHADHPLLTLRLQCYFYTSGMFMYLYGKKVSDILLVCRLAWDVGICKNENFND